MLVHVSVSAVITANHRAMPDPNECLHGFFLVCGFLGFFYTWNQVTEGLIRLFTFVVPVLFECCFFPASVSRCFSRGALLGLLRPFQPPRRQRRITAGDESAGHQSYRRAQFTVSYIAAVVSPSASISSYVTCGKDENTSSSPSE